MTCAKMTFNIMIANLSSAFVQRLSQRVQPFLLRRANRVHGKVFVRGFFAQGFDLVADFQYAVVVHPVDLGDRDQTPIDAEQIRPGVGDGALR